MTQMQSFIEKVKNDKELMTKLDALGANGAEADKIIALAAEYGFNMTEEDFRRVVEAAEAQHMKTGELGEEDLDAVAGGNGGATQNRWDPKVCNNYDRTHYYCVGFLASCWCDHYERKWYYTDKTGYTEYTTYRHICHMGRFNYIADHDGNI